jgi:hypothetical protein
MSIDVIEKIKQLPADKQKEVEDFINFLASKYVVSAEAVELVENKRRQNIGRLHGKIHISDDFNITPDDFKNYL